MASLKSRTREEYRRKQGQAFNEKDFNRLWRTTTQHIRRIAGNVVNPSVEAYYHLTKNGEDVLSYTYQQYANSGGARGHKEDIQEYFKTKFTTERTANFISKHKNQNVGGHKLKTWLKYYQEGLISKEEYYSKIELFKTTNKKYLSTGSK